MKLNKNDKNTLWVCFIASIKNKSQILTTNLIDISIDNINDDKTIDIILNDGKKENDFKKVNLFSISSP